MIKKHYSAKWSRKLDVGAPGWQVCLVMILNILALTHFIHALVAISQLCLYFAGLIPFQLALICHVWPRTAVGIANVFVTVAAHLFWKANQNFVASHVRLCLIVTLQRHLRSFLMKQSWQKSLRVIVVLRIHHWLHSWRRSFQHLQATLYWESTYVDLMRTYKSSLKVKFLLSAKSNRPQIKC